MLEDKINFYVELLANYYAEVLGKKLGVLENQSREIEKYGDVLTETGFNVTAFLSKNNDDKISILSMISDSFEIPETIKSIEQYAIIKNGNNQLLLQSKQFKEKQELIDQISKKSKEYRDSIINQEAELFSIGAKMHVLIKILRNEIPENLELNSENLGELIEIPIFNEKQKTELLALLAKISSKHFKEQLDLRDRRIIEEIEENDSRLREQAVVVEESTIEKRAKEMIKAAIQENDELQNNISFLPQQNDLIDEIIIFMIDKGEELDDIDEESVKRNILEYVKETLIKEKRKKLNRIIETDVIQNMINGYLPNSFDINQEKEKMLESFENNNKLLNEDSVKQFLLEKIIENENKHIDNAHSNLAIVKSILDDNITKSITSSNNDYYDEELIKETKEKILNQGITSETIEKQLEDLEELKGYIKANIYILFENPETFNDENYKQLEKVTKAINIIKEFNSFIIKENEFYDFIESNMIMDLVEKLINTSKEVGLLFESSEPIHTPDPIEEDEDDDLEEGNVKDYYRKILFTKDFIEDIKTMSIGNKKGVNKIFSCINQLETTDSLTDVTFRYHGFVLKNVGHRLKLLVDKGVITNSGRADVRFFFIPKTKTNPDGTKETYYVIFYADKKLNNNDNETANRVNGNNRLSNTIDEVNLLLAKMDDEQEFDNARHDQLKYIKEMIKALA